MTVKETDILNEIVVRAKANDEHTLKRSRDFWDQPADEGEDDALNIEFRQAYMAVAQQIAQDWGPPAFQGGWEAEGFPEWSQGIEMAYWIRGDYVAYVAFSHEDKELPMTVTLGAVPKEEAA